jgi:hypothetical protein
MAAPKGALRVAVLVKRTLAAGGELSPAIPA